jgi:futalosine hydrolase
MSHDLILVPTPLELEAIAPRLSSRPDNLSLKIELCGFGPIAAAARAAQLIAEIRPWRVIVAGIAGAYEDRVPIGSAVGFDSVGCYGVGAATGEKHQSASDMGWSQWSGDPESEEPKSDSIGDRIVLSGQAAIQRSGSLITCCSASGDASDVALRLKKFPDSVAEDMEGFGVAMACRLAGVECEIVRGISNRAGDRNKANWRIQDALDAVASLLLELTTDC